LVSYNKYDSTGIVKTITHDICNTVFLHKGATNIKIYGNNETQNIAIWVIGGNKGGTTYTEYKYNVSTASLVQNYSPPYVPVGNTIPIHIYNFAEGYDYYILNIIGTTTDNL